MKERDFLKSTININFKKTHFPETNSKVMPKFEVIIGKQNLLNSIEQGEVKLDSFHACINNDLKVENHDEAID